MADPISAGLIGVVLGAAVSLTDLGETIYGWFYEPEPMCNTKVNNNPEQWGYRPCIEVVDDTTQTTSN